MAAPTLSAASPPRFAWTETPGVCLRSRSCDVGRSGQLLFVALQQPFVCPACGSPLAAPLQQTELPKSSQVSARPMIMAGASCVLLGCAVISGMMNGTAHTPALPVADSVVPARPAVQTVVATRRAAPAAPLAMQAAGGGQAAAAASMALR